MTNNEEIIFLEQIAMNAWPAYKTQVYDGWIMRFTNGVTRRSNSINPLFEGKLELANKITFCENIYKTQNLPPTYKLTPAVCPSELDEELNKRGYTTNAQTSLQVVATENFILPDEDIFSVNNTITNTWLKNSLELNEYRPELFNDYKTIFSGIINSACFIEICIEGKIIGSAMAVVEQEYVGLFDIVIANEYRKKGYATKLVTYLISWGKSQGAKQAYLQVMLNNQSALALYKKMGFTELYQYWYRVKSIS